MPFKIVRNDIVNIHADALVNTANPHPVIGTGVDTALHKKAGAKLLEARKNIGDINMGEASITPAYELDAKYVIHTVGPLWVDGNHSEQEILASCYKNCLKLAKEYKLKSIAFPLIATGNYGFPKPLALSTAVREISSFLMDNDMLIYLVVFGKSAFQLSEKLFEKVSSYIDENYIEEKIHEEYGLKGTAYGRILSKRCKEDFPDDGIYRMSMSIGAAVPSEDELKQKLKKLDLGFSETLLKLIDESGKTDPEIYKRANVDRKLFSKIRNNPKYKPSKTTALAFALALQLDLEETRDLIGRAGYALSNCSKFDVIVEFFIENKNYDVYELNEVLFEFDQPLIGA